MLTDGGPTDSESLSWLFQYHGVNMRYLGEVISRLKKLVDSEQGKVKYKHIEFLIEKEIFVRSLKHALGLYLSETKQENVQALIAHLFNCIFSPHIIM